MAGLLDFLPLFQETAASIRARMDADVNAGLAADDPQRLDTREGSFYYDITQVVVLELARLWDALAVDVPAAAFAPFAWGDYLDYHAEVFGIERKQAVRATGEVLFAGDAGAVVSGNTVVSAQVEGADGPETLEFRTTESGTLPAQVSRPGTITITPSDTGGVLTTGTYYYRVAALNALGETNGSDEASAMVVGTTGRITLDWPDVAGATGYRVYRSTVEGGPYRQVADVTPSTYVDAGGQVLGVSGPPAVNTTAAVLLGVEAVDAGALGNVGAGAITSLETANDGIDLVRNALPMTGGTERESDVGLRDRILIQYAGGGPGNVTDYRRWALEEPGVGRVSVVPAGYGPGTVQVVVMTETGDPVAPATVTSLQTRLDPIAGAGAGEAPVGIRVYVETPTARAIDVVAAVQHRPGYNLDGTGGQIATRGPIEAALREYLDALDVGEDVVYNHVVAQFFRVPGVLNVSGVTVEGGTADIAIIGSPPEIAQFGSATLT